MEALRRIVRCDATDLLIKIPSSFIKHKLEVIIIKTEDMAQATKQKINNQRPAVGTVTSKNVVMKSDVFKPFNNEELKDWGLN